LLDLFDQSDQSEVILWYIELIDLLTTAWSIARVVKGSHEGLTSLETQLDVPLFLLKQGLFHLGDLTIKLEDVILELSISLSVGLGKLRLLELKGELSDLFIQDHVSILQFLIPHLES